MPSPVKKSAAAAAKNTPKTPVAKAETIPVAAKPLGNTAPAAAKAPTKTPASAPAKGTLSPAERMKMIAEAAYFLAQKRGFTGGDQLSDWVAAEQQVDAVVSKRG